MGVSNTFRVNQLSLFTNRLAKWFPILTMANNWREKLREMVLLDSISAQMLLKERNLLVS